MTEKEIKNWALTALFVESVEAFRIRNNREPTEYEEVDLLDLITDQDINKRCQQMTHILGDTSYETKRTD